MFPFHKFVGVGCWIHVRITDVRSIDELRCYRCAFWVDFSPHVAHVIAVFHTFSHQNGVSLDKVFSGVSLTMYLDVKMAQKLGSCHNFSGEINREKIATDKLRLPRLPFNNIKKQLSRRGNFSIIIFVNVSFSLYEWWWYFPATFSVHCITGN